MYIILIVTLVIAIVAYVAIKLTQLNIQKLILVVIGLVVGSLVGALLSVPLNKLPGIYGDVLPIVVTVMTVIAFVVVFYSQYKVITQLFPKFMSRNPKKTTDKATSDDITLISNNKILVDTSAIIDGRIADIVKTGFVPGKLLVPRFILAELQNIADSEESMRRSRGRRGLEVLNMMRQNELVEIDIVEEDPENVKEVDHKLVYLAKKYKTNILTTDYNLNRVATIEAVHVLNINELANAIRAVVLPGEELIVKVVQTGKEKNQGVGYLPDGTMIVVENGDKLIGREVTTEVTRIFQTVAGKMIFAAEKTKNRHNISDKPHAKNGRTRIDSKNNHDKKTTRNGHINKKSS